MMRFLVRASPYWPAVCRAATRGLTHDRTDHDLDSIDFSCISRGIHTWMENLYYAKGGCDIDFNCANVALTAEDLDRLEADIRANALPFTAGFFFGESDGSETEGDLAFIEKARVAIAEGKTVFYTSWW